jgi:hypothetical protein
VVLQRVADSLDGFVKPFRTTLSNQLLHEASAAAAGAIGPPLLDDAGYGPPDFARNVVFCPLSQVPSL